jgi:hypothetical protein
MFDPQNKQSMNQILSYDQDLVRVRNKNNQPIPIIVVASKSETYPLSSYVNTNISTKTQTNVYEPLLILARNLTKDPSLVFLQQENPPQVHFV